MGIEEKLKHNKICPLCNSKDNEKRFSERGYDLLMCHICELFFINPYPENIVEAHNKVSKYNYDEIKIINATRYYQSQVEYYKKIFPLIDQECKNIASVLDVGCGCGHLLERLSIYPNLFRVGIELNTERAEMARKISGCEIHQVPIEEFSSKIKFDVITMINVLSHIPSFDRLFNSINSLLQDNGKLILKVGEMKKNVQRINTFDWGIPDHLHFLGLNTIDFISRQFSFKIYKHIRIPYTDVLFSTEKWKSSGRSDIRNMMKHIVVHIPFALKALSISYDIVFGRKIYSSFIVLSKQT